jgi:anthranilate synthase component 2
VLIDNYDSFTFNLFQLLAGLGAQVDVYRNDAITGDAVDALCPSHIVLSPGPGHPQNSRDFGVCAQLVQASVPTRPLLGVCLGHQGLAHYLGGRVVRAPCVMHGKSSTIRHDQTGLFRGLPDFMPAMRYHSLVVDPGSLPASLRITARTEDGVVMGIAHRFLPMFGVQFHPESIGTPQGRDLLLNFLEMP